MTTVITTRHNGHAVRALFARPAAIVKGIVMGSRDGGELILRDTGEVAEKLRRDLAHNFHPATRVRRDADRLCALYGVQAAREFLEAGLDQVRLYDAAARDHAQTVREAQGQQEIGL